MRARVTDALYLTMSLTFRKVNSEFKIRFSPFSDTKQVTHRRHKNMDYSVTNALSYNSEGLKEFALIYDIACQFHVHFEQRVADNPDLSLPSFKKLIMAVGKFHLGAHVEKCFYEFSLDFIEGTGQVDGEIVETLWSLWMRIAIMARAMTEARRREVLDTLMRDSNFKKIMRSSELCAFPLPSKRKVTKLLVIYSPVKALITKRQNAIEQSAALSKEFSDLSSSVELHLQEQWCAEERVALDGDREELNIYAVRMKEGKSCSLLLMLPIASFLQFETAPTLAQIRLALSEDEAQHSLEPGVTAWLTSGIHIQEAQCVFCNSLTLLFP